MSRKLVVACIAFVAASLSPLAIAQEHSPVPNEPTQSIDMESELLARDLNYVLAPVKAQADLVALMDSGNESPLDQLSAAAKRRFVGSLTFGKGGLSGFRYDDLEAELTPTQIYKVLALFGQQHNTHRLEKARVETTLDRQILSMNAARKCFGGPGGPLGNTGCEIGFLEDYKCESPGTCLMDNMRACTDNC